MARDTVQELLVNGQRMRGSDVVTGDAGDQPGACPILDGAPTLAELPTDQGTGEPTALIYLDQTDNIVKIAAPDGSGGVATGNVLDLSASISLGTGDLTGLL